MQPYAAVTTTGIYCRPGCGARPRADHVRRYPAAAAAEAAGYRACLRCRPYRNPEPMPATGPELVCRAVQLVLDGALDGATEAALAARLGMTGRHLRRLFVGHLGVTPDGLARSARAHFARRLLDDTDLPVTEVAYAAGFSSVRQFNRSCKAVFGRSPSSLRALRRRADRLVADGGLLLRLPFTGPLDWPATLHLLAAHAVPGVENVAAGSYRRTIILHGYPGALELTDGGPDHLLLRLHLPRWHELVHLTRRARRLISLDLPLDAAIRQLAADPQLAPLIGRRPGLRPPGAWDPVEAAVRAILDDGDPTETGTRLAGELVRAHGTPVAGLTQLGLTHTFPTASRLAAAPLLDLGLPLEAVTAIHRCCTAVATGAVRLDSSATLPQLLTSLTDNCGMTDRAAAHLALRLGEGDAYPPPDGHGGWRDHGGRQWAPWRAVAATHLRTAEAETSTRATAGRQRDVTRHSDARAKPIIAPSPEVYGPITRQAERTWATTSSRVRQRPQYASVERKSHTMSRSIRTGSSSTT